MDEWGEVVGFRGNRALVRTVRSEHCASCGACQLGQEAGGQVLEVESIPGIRVGSRVKIELEPAEVLRAAGLLYFVPLLGLFMGFALGGAMGRRLGMSPDIARLVVGLGFMFAIYAGVAWYDRRQKRSGRYQPRIVLADQ